MVVIELIIPNTYDEYQWKREKSHTAAENISREQSTIVPQTHKPKTHNWRCRREVEWDEKRGKARKTRGKSVTKKMHKKHRVFSSHLFFWFIAADCTFAICMDYCMYFGNKSSERANTRIEQQKTAEIFFFRNGKLLFEKSILTSKTLHSNKKYSERSNSKQPTTHFTLNFRIDEIEDDFAYSCNVEIGRFVAGKNVIFESPSLLLNSNRHYRRVYVNVCLLRILCRCGIFFKVPYGTYIIANLCIVLRNF